jgi:hypothetical protein
LPAGWETEPNLAETLIDWLSAPERRYRLVIVRPMGSLEPVGSAGGENQDEDDIPALDPGEPALPAAAAEFALQHADLVEMDDHFFEQGSRARTFNAPPPGQRGTAGPPNDAAQGGPQETEVDGPSPRSLVGQVVELRLAGWTAAEIAAGLSLKEEEVVEQLTAARLYMQNRR